MLEELELLWLEEDEEEVKTLGSEELSLLCALEDGSEIEEVLLGCALGVHAAAARDKAIKANIDFFMMGPLKKFIENEPIFGAKRKKATNMCVYTHTQEKKSKYREERVLRKQHFFKISFPL